VIQLNSSKGGGRGVKDIQKFNVTLLYENGEQCMTKVGYG